MGNNSFKNYGKELLEKITAEEELSKIVFYFEPKREMITFRCIYKNSEGKLHTFSVDSLQGNEEQPKRSPQKPKK